MNKELSGILKLNRSMQNITIASIADELNINSSQISKIEHGSEMSQEKIIQIMNVLDIDCKNVTEISNQITTLSKSIFMDIYFCENEKKIKLNIDKLNQLINDNFYTFDAILINIIYSISFAHIDEKIIHYISTLEDSLEYLTYKQKQLYFQYTAIYHVTYGNVKLAKYFLEEAKSITFDDYSKSLLLYHSALIHIKAKQITKSTENIIEAKNLFDKLNNNIMSNRCLLIKARIAMQDSCYDYSRDILNNLLSIYKRTNVSDAAIAEALNQKLNIFILEKKYDDFLNEIKNLDLKYKEILEQDTIYNFNLSVAYYFVNLKEDCIYYCNKTKYTHPNPIIDNVINYFLFKMRSPKKNLRKSLSFLNKSLKLSEKYLDFSYYTLINELIIDEYLFINNYEQACKYLQKLSNNSSF